MKRKIVITLVALAVGLLTLLGYNKVAETVQNAEALQHLHVPAFVSSALETLGAPGVGVILMVIVIAVAVLVFRGKGEDTM